MPGRGEMVTEAVDGPVGDAVTDGDLRASMVIMTYPTQGLLKSGWPGLGIG